MPRMDARSVNPPQVWKGADDGRARRACPVVQSCVCPCDHHLLKVVRDPGSWSCGGWCGNMCTTTRRQRGRRHRRSGWTRPSKGEGFALKFCVPCATKLGTQHTRECRACRVTQVTTAELPLHVTDARLPLLIVRLKRLLFPAMRHGSRARPLCLPPIPFVLEDNQSSASARTHRLLSCSHRHREYIISTTMQRGP